jgi:hypothetical protein
MEQKTPRNAIVSIPSNVVCFSISVLEKPFTLLVITKGKEALVVFSDKDGISLSRKWGTT